MKDPDRELLHGNAETLVLALLAEDECYGYQIRQELALRSHHYFQFALGGVYPLLRGLRRRGLVKARRVKAGKARERKYYTITPQGRAQLRKREMKWRQFRNGMHLVLASCGRRKG